MEGPDTGSADPLSPGDAGGADTRVCITTISGWKCFDWRGLGNRRPYELLRRYRCIKSASNVLAKIIEPMVKKQP
jgi:hypothetical protein